MTDQPTNPNEFILIAAYRKVQQTTKLASISMFKSACKKARLCKTGVTADLDIRDVSVGIVSMINKHQIAVDLRNGIILSIDGYKMMADIKSLAVKTSDSEHHLKINSIAKLSMPDSVGASLMLMRNDLMVYFLNYGLLQFVKDDVKLLEVMVLDAEKQQINQFDLDNRSGLCLFGRSCNSWKGYVLFVSKDS